MIEIAELVHKTPDPACPNFADQRKLFALLKSEGIVVQLAEGDIMDPEALVSALILHPSQAESFSVVPEA